MNTQTGPMKAILTFMVSAFLLLSACGTDTDSALEAAEEVPAAEETATTAVLDEGEEVPGLEPGLEEAVAGMTVAWGNADGNLAWTFDSERCRDGMAEAPDGYVALVADYGATYPGVTASNITAVVGDDRAAVSYDVYDGAGDFVANYNAQPWILADGKWLRDPC